MFVLVNLKAYSCDPVSIAKSAAMISEEASVDIGVAPQTAHLSAVSTAGATAWAQHVSPIEPGSHTGSTLASVVAGVGASGTLLNHSENRLKLADIDKGIKAAQSADLKTVICANNPEQVAAAAALGPTAVAVEPPELIGTGTPVSQADPEVVSEAVEAATAVDSSVEVYCGAGISTGEDVSAAADLGADGVLLASGVAKAENPTAVLRDLVSSV